MQLANVQITIDGCNYGVGEVEMPEVVGDTPTGKTLTVKAVDIHVPPSQDGGANLSIRLLFSHDAFAEWVKTMIGGRLTVASAADLAVIENAPGNGGKRAY